MAYHYEYSTYNTLRDTLRSRREHLTQRFYKRNIDCSSSCYYQNNMTSLLNCVAQTNTNPLELELNDFETPVSRPVYPISVANSKSRCTFDYIFYVSIV